MDATILSKCCNQLLNLDKRNRLLYFKNGPRYLSLFSKMDSSSLFDDFVGGKVFSFFDLDSLQKERNITNEDFRGTNSAKTLLFHEAMERRGSEKSDLILARPFRPTLYRTLKNRDSIEKASIEDHGISLLYLSMGRLNWKETKDSDEFVSSPLLLLPALLKRNGGQNPYTFKRNDRAEISFNNTLAFKLKSDFGIVLPEFDSEKDDYLSYCQKVKEAIKDYPDWSVQDENHLGLFSFSKIERYKDLKEHEATVLSNKNIQRLFGSEEESFSPEQNASNDKDKEKRDVSYLPLHNVVDADSSQEKAIRRAKKGISFVLEGPPGTGKSQTITNIIAEARYDGKSVLFVAEKSAALDVVYHKLSLAHLSDFCLYLNSKDSEKKAVIKDIQHVLDLPLAKVSEEGRKVRQELSKEREFLDSYAKETGRICPERNEPVYRILSQASALKDIQGPSFLFPPSSLNKEALEEDLDTLEQIRSLAAKLGRRPTEYAFYGFKEKDGGYEFKFNLEKDFGSLSSLLAKDKRKTEAFLSLFERSKASSRSQILKAEEESGELSSFTLFDPLRFDQGHIKSLHLLVDKAVEDLGIFKGNGFRHGKDPAILSLDGKKTLDKFKGEYSGLFRFRNKEYRNTRKCLSGYRKTKLNYKGGLEVLEGLSLYQKQKQDSKESLEALNAALSSLSLSVEDLNVFKKERDKLLSFTSLPFVPLSKRNASLFEQRKETLSSLSLMEDGESIKKIADYFDPRQLDVLSLSYDGLYRKVQAVRENRNRFDDERKRFRLLSKTKEENILPFVKDYLNNDFTLDQIQNALKKCFFIQLSHRLIEQNDRLRYLTSEDRNGREKSFQKNDKRSFDISQVEIYQQRISSLRSSLDRNRGLAAGLDREAAKKSRIISIRQLRIKYGQLVRKLKPCFRRSPLSVSSYLDDSFRFDRVIFDEASQVFPWDAIGSIYRGSQLIVCGDRKQRPPSSFFQATVDDVGEEGEDSATDISSFESILDYANFFPHYPLTWHYRSRNEDVIAFSNANFYDGKLTTFPSAKTKRKGFGVDFYFVSDGNYRRKAGNNPNEARRVVDLVCEDIRKYPSRSIGVVARGSSQQEEIQSQLEDRERKDSVLRDYRSKATSEPIFVKNLENVQGDERDRIILSIGYGKDESGNLYHNFGPLNNQGGERRLNVAITRSRENVQVVSSIRYNDIDRNRTNAVGRKRLKGYLEYAEFGTTSSLSKGSNTENPDTALPKDSVYDALVSHGYKVDRKVGCSGYRIDFAIRHPQYGNYVLAIECDGETYHDAKSVRDRDRLREEILKSKGWNFYRVWLPFWFLRRKEEENLLFKAVDCALSTAKPSFEEPDGKDHPSLSSPDLGEEKTDPVLEKKEEAMPVTEEISTTAEPVSEEEPALRDDGKDGVKNEAPKSTELDEEPKPLEENPDKEEPNGFWQIENKTASYSSREDWFPPYKEYEPESVDFSDESLKENLIALIKREQPVYEYKILRSFAKWIGYQKVTNYVRDSFEDRMKSIYYPTIHKSKSLLYESSYYYYIDDIRNCPLRYGGNRGIPDPEYENGILTVIEHERVISRKELARFFSNLFGFSSTSKVISKEVSFFVDQLIKQGKVVCDKEDNLSLADTLDDLDSL